MRGMKRLALLGVPGAQGAGVSYPTEITDDFSADSGEWLDGDLQPVAMAVESGRGIWTPTLDAELVSNGDMETGDPPSNWTAGNGAVLAAVADERPGGAGSASLSITNGEANFGGATQPIGNPEGQWFVLSGWHKRVTGTPSPAIIYSGADIFTNSSSWTFSVASSVTTAANSLLRVTLNTTTLGAAGYFDDISVKNITSAGLVRVRRIYVPSYVEAAIYRGSTRIQKGVVLYKDANNYILAYLLSGAVKLRKKVAGTLSAELGTANITYAAGAKLRLTPNETFTAFSVAYGGTEMIAPVAVADFEGMEGEWYAGLFNTYDWGDISTDAFDDFAAITVF